MAPLSLTTILAFDTSTEYCSVALRRDGWHCDQSVWAGQAHSEMLLPMIAAALGQANIAASACDAIAFGAGPGSFTGLRIACSVAQGLSIGLGRPVVAIGTLLAMAEHARAEHLHGLAAGQHVLVAQDARMGELYWAVYEWAAQGWVPVIEPSLSSIAQLAAGLAFTPKWGVGNAFSRFPDDLTHRVEGVVEVLAPSASAIARLAEGDFLCGLAAPAQYATPVYVRDQVALTTAQRAALQ
jgi:tRNA threonylcarbamoyladenosine biosynthesis protein TsaB